MSGNAQGPWRHERTRGLPLQRRRVLLEEQNFLPVSGYGCFEIENILSTSWIEFDGGVIH